LAEILTDYNVPSETEKSKMRKQIKKTVSKNYSKIIQTFLFLEENEINLE